MAFNLWLPKAGEGLSDFSGGKGWCRPNRAGVGSLVPVAPISAALRDTLTRNFGRRCRGVLRQSPKSPASGLPTIHAICRALPGSTLGHSHFPCMRAMLCVELRMTPTLRYQEWQVVDPILLTHTAWVDHVAEVVFGIRDNKIGVGE